jgi:uncharacterized membrane protein YoaT (DUF817 family)
VLLAALIVLHGRTWVWFRVHGPPQRMPLLVGLLLVALFIWFAENLATWARIWLYPTQGDGWRPVPLTKLVAWLLLMYVSFTLVTLLHRRRRA